MVVVEIGARSSSAISTTPQHDRDALGDDAIVPSPLMPHLMFEWILERARERWPDGPSRRAARDDAARHAVAARDAERSALRELRRRGSCPINCIEPRNCPHTRDDARRGACR